jgi:hypothetical protein
MPASILVPEKKSGGILGAIGSVLGAVVGGVLAPVTAGASLGAAAAAIGGGAATGAGIGKTAGSLADAAIGGDKNPASVVNKTQTAPMISMEGPKPGAADVLSKIGGTISDVGGIASGIGSLGAPKLELNPNSADSIARRAAVIRSYNQVPGMKGMAKP